MYLRSQAHSGLSACEVNTYTSRVLTMRGNNVRCCVMLCCTYKQDHQHKHHCSCKGCKRPGFPSSTAQIASTLCA